jgi:plasmid maintenance system antidote protein VapI
MKVTDQLRDLVRGAGMTCQAIADATGVSNATLSRFLSGDRGLSCEAIDALGEYFGWHVVAREAKPRGKGK